MTMHCVSTFLQATTFLFKSHMRGLKQVVGNSRSIRSQGLWRSDSALSCHHNLESCERIVRLWNYNIFFLTKRVIHPSASSLLLKHLPEFSPIKTLQLKEHAVEVGSFRSITLFSSTESPIQFVKATMAGGVFWVSFLLLPFNVCFPPD